MYYSDNDFIPDSNCSEKIFKLLVRNNGIGSITPEFPDNLSVLTDATLKEVRKHGLPHIARLSGESSGFAITREFRSALETLDIETQEFHPLKFYASHSRSKSAYDESNHTLVHEGFFWKPLDVVDIIDFEVLADKVYYKGDDTPGPGRYCDKVDPTWPAGSFTVGKPVATRSDVKITQPIFSIRGLEGIFITAPFFRMMRDNDFLKYHPFKVLYLDPDRQLSLRQRTIEARAAGQVVVPRPVLDFVGTTMRAPDSYDWQANLSGL